MGTEGRSFDLHPDGERLAVSVLPQEMTLQISDFRFQIQFQS